MKRILILSHYLGFVGGIERYAQRMALLLRGQGFVVDLLYHTTCEESTEVAQSYDSLYSLDQLSSIPNEYDRVIIHKWLDIDSLKQIFAQITAKRLLFIHDHDLVCPRSFHYLPNPGRMRCPFAYNRLRCSICSCLRHPKHWPNRSLIQQFSKSWITHYHALTYLQQLPDTQVVTVSDFMKREFERCGFADVQVLPIFSVYPPEQEIPPPLTCFTEGIQPLLFVGQLIRGKGVETILRACALIKHPYQLTILGDGSDRARLEGLAKDFAVNVRFMGSVPSAVPYLKETQLLLVPSHWDEPGCTVLFEAAAWSKPVAASAVGGIPQFIKDGVTGRLLPPDSAAAFADAISDAYQSPLRYAQMGHAHHQWIGERYTAQPYLDNLKELL